MWTFEESSSGERNSRWFIRQNKSIRFETFSIGCSSNANGKWNGFPLPFSFRSCSIVFGGLSLSSQVFVRRTQIEWNHCIFWDAENLLSTGNIDAFEASLDIRISNGNVNFFLSLWSRSSNDAIEHQVMRNEKNRLTTFIDFNLNSEGDLLSLEASRSIVEERKPHTQTRTHTRKSSYPIDFKIARRDAKDVVESKQADCGWFRLFNFHICREREREFI